MEKKSENDIYTYESPDGGETIYRRKAGDEGRVLVKGSNNVYDMIQNDLESQPEFLESQSELTKLRQHVLNLEIANSDLTDMLRELGVVV
jgi:hypothetical protein